MVLQATTFLQWQHHFNISTRKALEHSDKSKTLHMMRNQCTLAANLEGAVQKAVTRRKKNWAGKYSYEMRKREAGQVYSMQWYKRHIKKLTAKMQEIDCTSTYPGVDLCV
ncbi:hypothetical protein T484DRAFT_1755092 [Baffinella frigidus]|nr:hypothetical protein T484DRAFT_1755092 [Cryptophyta sp. CCMP2293]